MENEKIAIEWFLEQVVIPFLSGIGMLVMFLVCWGVVLSCVYGIIGPHEIMWLRIVTGAVLIFLLGLASKV
jgi:hypothetical protein